MKFSTSTIVAAAAFLPAISAHLVMVTPQQWFVPEVIRDTVETSESQQHPLLADGSNYPCQGVAPEEPVATYEPGSMQTLQLQGTAVHSGGSGQMSITYDTTPTKDTKFRVMTSWEGGHPVDMVGNIMPADASHMLDPIQFKVPEGLPAGKAVVAWTWFNKEGNREMYMHCATVTIGGSETSKAAFEALPTMFRANSGNGCEVPANIQAIKFKNPGPHVVGTGTTPIDCDNTEAGSGSGSSDSSSSSSDSSSSSSGSGSGSSGSSDSSSSSGSDTSAPAASTGGSCVEGTITCNADGTWSLCGSGINTLMGAAPAGTTCQNGSFVKRNIRFSNEHMRRAYN